MQNVKCVFFVSLQTELEILIFSSVVASKVQQHLKLHRRIVDKRGHLTFDNWGHCSQPTGSSTNLLNDLISRVDRLSGLVSDTGPWLVASQQSTVTTEGSAWARNASETPVTCPSRNRRHQTRTTCDPRLFSANCDTSRSVRGVRRERGSVLADLSEVRCSL